MSDVKISALPDATGADAADVTPIVQGGVTSKVALSEIVDSTKVDAAGATMNADTDLSTNGYFLDEDGMTSDDPTKVASQQSIKAYVSGIVQGSIILQGDWDADTNTPDITSESTTGFAWRVSVAGATNLGGITTWGVNDWAVKSATGWVKIDNSTIAIVWGGIGGILANQTDLQSALDAKKADFAEGTAFNKAFGITVGTVCQGNDSRLSDSRTPTAHTDSHTNGDDDIHDASGTAKGLMNIIAQSIKGIKTFLSFPVGPSAAPTTDYQLANKKYVDDNSGGGSGFVTEAMYHSMISRLGYTTLRQMYEDSIDGPASGADWNADMFETLSKINLPVTNADYSSVTKSFSTISTGAESVGSVKITSTSSPVVSTFTVGGAAAISAPVDIVSGALIPAAAGTVYGTGTYKNPNTGGAQSNAVFFDGVKVGALAANATIGTSDSTTLESGKDWGSGNSSFVGKYVVYTPSDFALSEGRSVEIKLQGSDNASDWDTLHTKASQVYSVGETITVDTGVIITTAYRYHRLLFTIGATNWIAMLEIEFFTLGGLPGLVDSINAGPLSGSVTASTAVAGATGDVVITYDAVGDANNGIAIDGTGTDVTFSDAIDTRYGHDATNDGVVQSTDFVVLTDPDTADILMVHDWGTTGTMNTDLIVSVSRDGGANFSPVTMTLEGIFIDAQEYWSGSADVSGQPAGNDLVLKMQGVNGVESILSGQSTQAIL